MSIINNPQAIKELVSAANLQVGFDEVPTKLANSVVPVININPKDYRRVNVMANATCSNSTSSTIYTTPTDRDFYITGACLSIIKDATSTSTSSNIQTSFNGEGSKILLQITGFSLTVQDQTVATPFIPPIKVDRGVTIVVTASTNVANVTARGAIYGYIVENNQ